MVGALPWILREFLARALLKGVAIRRVQQCAHLSLSPRSDVFFFVLCVCVCVCVWEAISLSHCCMGKTETGSSVPHLRLLRFTAS